MDSRAKYSIILDKLLYTWMVCFGMLSLLVVSGWFIPHRWIPFLGYTMILGIIAFGNYTFDSSGYNCSLITHYTFYALFLSSTIMLCINVLTTSWFTTPIDYWLNFDIPYIPALVVYPITLLTAGIAILRKNKTKYCKACLQRGGYSVRDTIECNLFHIQARNQVKLAIVISLCMSIIEALYYSLFYINVNINSPDIFFFFLTPLVVYVLSVIYLFFSYNSMKFQIRMEPVQATSYKHTDVRFMVLCDDKIILEEMHDSKAGIGLWDTPAISEIEFTEKMSPIDAREIFAEISGADDFEIKPLFSTSTMKHNAFHYVAILKSGTSQVPGLDGSWFNIYEINQMLKQSLISRPFAYEIHRIFTMTMAWKTYTRDGKRLYPIKNYRPTFRLTDFKDWDLDYSDMHWMHVAENNEDRPFFKVRRLWRKYVSGVEKEWKGDR